MHHGDGRRYLGQRDRPIDRGVAAAGDNNPFATECLAALHQIEDAFAFVLGQTGQGRAMRAESADPGGDHHRAGFDDRAAGIGQAPAVFADGFQVRHRVAEMVHRFERRRLLCQPVDQLLGLDDRITGDIVDRLFRVERHALPAGGG